MRYLAVKNGDYKGCYAYSGKKERAALVKIVADGNISHRDFDENQKTEALKWCGVTELSTISNTALAAADSESNNNKLSSIFVKLIAKGVPIVRITLSSGESFLVPIQNSLIWNKFDYVAVCYSCNYRNCSRKNDTCLSYPAENCCIYVDKDNSNPLVNITASSIKQRDSIDRAFIGGVLERGVNIKNTPFTYEMAVENWFYDLDKIVGSDNCESVKEKIFAFLQKTFNIFTVMLPTSVVFLDENFVMLNHCFDKLEGTSRSGGDIYTPNRNDICVININQIASVTPFKANRQIVTDKSVYDIIVHV